MTRLRALNESASDDSEEENEEKETIEAQEERAFTHYKQALEFRQQGRYSDAEHLLISLLNDDFLANVAPDDHATGVDGLARPAAALKYACLKNLGNVLVLQGRAEDGLQCFIQAVELDESDVTMWHQMGTVALQIDDFHLASQAFQEGLRCNPRHWPCLDSLLPVLYSLNDYLGCLLLVSRALELDSECSLALALRHQISKEDSSLLENFKHFYPDANDITVVTSKIDEEEMSRLVANVLSLQERFRIKHAFQSDTFLENESRKVTATLQSKTWEDLGKCLLQTYNSITRSEDESYLHMVEVISSLSSKSSECELPSSPSTANGNAVQTDVASSLVADTENEVIDVDSEQDAKGEDQTEEDATEASGLEQEEEAKTPSLVPQNTAVRKRKRERLPTTGTLMDSWSKRRSGRRSTRKAEDREESNLASCFRSLLPDSLLPKDLEAEIAKASRRRSLRDPAELLAWGDDSLDAVELCRLLQERDAKDEQQRKAGKNTKDNYAQRLLYENYFGTEKEVSDVCTLIEKYGSGSQNIIQLVTEFVRVLAQKNYLTWPSGLIPLYVELFESMRRHVPWPSPFDSQGFNQVNVDNLFSSLLYCELNVDLWQQKSQSDQDFVSESGSLLGEALGNVMLLSGLAHIFSSSSEQCKVILRIHWLKVHLSLLQENSPSAINSLHDVLQSFDVLATVETSSHKETDDLEVKASDLNKTKDTATEADTCPDLKQMHSESEDISPVINLKELEASKETDTEKQSVDPDNELMDISETNVQTNLTNTLEVKNVTCATSSSQQNSHDNQDKITAKHEEGSLCPDTIMQTSPTTLHGGVLFEENLDPKSSAAGPGKSDFKLEDISDDADVRVLGLPCQSEKPCMDSAPLADEPMEVGSGNEVEEPVADANCVAGEHSLVIPASHIKEEKVGTESECGTVEGTDGADAHVKVEVDDVVETVDGTATDVSEKLDLLSSIVRIEHPDVTEKTSPQNDHLQQYATSNSEISETFATQKQTPSATEAEPAACNPLTSTCNSSEVDVNSEITHSVSSVNETQNSDKKASEEEQSQDCSSKLVKSNSSVFLPNCRLNQDINKRAAQKLLMSLTRQQQLSEVDELYSSGQYEVLSSTLTECFKYCAQQADCENTETNNLPDRPTQMAMLLDSLWKLQRYNDCFYWTEACLHEAFNRYLNSIESDNTSQEHEDNQMWATTVERLLAGLNGCLKVAELSLLEKVPKACITRLVQTLISILCQQLEQSDSSVEMAIECTTPWVILHRVIYFEEQQLPVCQDAIPAYMGVLFTAHEYMAKKARCCLNEGILLNLILDVVVPQLRSADFIGVRSTLNHEVEQAILCLIGHPKKPTERSKKRLQDHKVHQHLELTWERSLTLLRFYEPDELPAFDSTAKLSPEEEQLFLRILQLVPSDGNPSKYTSKMKAFLKGSSDTLPEVESSLPEAAWNLYYLLADYYLKTFKWEAAVKYYLLDVCLNPYRFDSWAGMALARATRLFTDINSCDTFDNDLQLRRKTEAQQCFEKAVELDPENTTMWIEFGNFAYTVHSFCSRLLKTETDSLSLEMFTKVEEEKDRMLATTERCFRAAEMLDQDEPWLQQYMLGKVAEKRGEGPFVFLKHYRLAAQLLFEAKAVYPLTVNYDPPQHYAFEAHEIHYRIHASILKDLELKEGKYLTDDVENLYKEILREAAEGPFMAVRRASQLAMSAKRASIDPVESMGKKIKLDEPAVINISDEVENKPNAPPMSCTTSKTQGIMDTKLKPNDDIQLLASAETKDIVSGNVTPFPLGGVVVHDQGVDTSQAKGVVENASTTVSSSDYENKVTDPGCSVALATEQYTKPEGKAPSVNIQQLVSEKGGDIKSNSSDQVDRSKLNSATTSSATVKVDERNLIKSDQVTNDPGSDGSTSSELPSNNLCSGSGKELGKRNLTKQDSTHDLSKESNKMDVPKVNIDYIKDVPSSCEKSLDHAEMINQCLTGIEECLVRYPRHYKSLFRLCHYYFRSKRNRNLRKCRQLLLGDYRVMRLNKNIAGLFKSANINSMFNDVWRMPIDEIDRAGSFATHMSRCVHLLIEVLRAQRDHAMLLKLSIFLKRDPEKKDKKYLRDNERADLSKQALVMCLAAMRECVNETRSVDHVIELYRTVKDGIKEIPPKEGSFKTLLSDAYRKLKGLSQTDQSFYESAVELCQNELNLRKVSADAKVKAQVQVVQAQVQAQAQAQAQAQFQFQVQAAQAQAQAQALQMGVNPLATTLPFNPLAPRFAPTGSAPLVGNALASLAAPLFLPQMPVYRGRGRPPKAQQSLHNAMMNMAQFINLANSASNTVDQSKSKVMKQQQKQRRSQQPPAAAPGGVVSSIMKDRPALSITTLPSSSGATTSTAASNSSPGPATGTSSPKPLPPPHPLPPPSGTGQSAWQPRPRHSFPKPMSDPRSMLNSAAPRAKHTPRSVPRPNASTSTGPRAFVQPPSRPFGSQPAPSASLPAPLSNPAALLSRLPGIQVKPKSQSSPPASSHPQAYGSFPEQQSKGSKVKDIARQQLQSLERLQKLQMASSQGSKPAVMFTKVSAPSPQAGQAPGQGSGSGNADGSDSKKKGDPNFDIITLD
ncbi:hypothetical protein ONE63_008831 [Megalurothrips usitatus]|uniref:Calcineurin-binding protein cabin-1-like n=1 Tax=Megalurothrips usitatus TaxID=439358 RepID=A0AAV7XQU2_9NEOP|nr:hypothetical protein ONE63_008831 [Megalurothrips usitatus]